MFIVFLCLYKFLGQVFENHEGYIYKIQENTQKDNVLKWCYFGSNRPRVSPKLPQSEILGHE